jgi:hypothetical protein
MELANEAEKVVFSRRSAHVPIDIRSPRLVGSVISLAQALERGDREAVAVWDDSLDRLPALEVRDSNSMPALLPTLRAKALGSILVDLAQSGWSVSVEGRQVFVVAPEWSAGAGRLSPEQVRAEKERAREAMAARVQEEIESEGTRRFILRMETPRATEAGARSVLSLFADGPALAEALRVRGPEAIQPYLQLADGDAGRDPHTGLSYGDIFRYFRMYWSFPMLSTPGRMIPFLIRDAGQPSHPVCGLIAVASPVPRLTPRDETFGWTAAWLEAVVAALDFPPDEPAEHLRALGNVWRRSLDRTMNPSSIFEDVAALLKLPPTRDPDGLASAIMALPRAQRLRRAERARRDILQDLRDELCDALRAISFRGFGFNHDQALERPAKVREALEERKEEAYERWHESRKVTGASGTQSARLDKGALQAERAIRAAAKEPLFLKKRIAQAANILRAWEEIMPRPDESSGKLLRAWTLGSRARTGMFTGGESVARGLRTAMLYRQNRIVASQVADVCVCGAVPPYGPLLGGKLAALAALSRDVAAAYHTRYDGKSSEITSQMAARAFSRPADLLALTTTSFYGVGSSQYERLVLPTGDGEIRWRPVGRSKGNGSMHFSRRTTELMARLLKLETGKHLITSRFGEGPSERLRKLRDGLQLLGIDADELLEHGMPRLVYVAELCPRKTRPGARVAAPAWRRVGPGMEDVVRFWRERWLTSRLKSTPEVLEEVKAFSRETALLSRRIRPLSSWRHGGSR